MKTIKPREPFRMALATSLLMLLAACSNAAEAAQYTMFRDPGCGCCQKWADHVETSIKATVVTVDSADMAQVKIDHNVPAELLSCHTMLAGDYVIEGHVPAEAIARLLQEPPAGVTGLAVAGMPLGSPGMEVGGKSQPYEVIAFGPKGQKVFAAYN